MNSRARHIWLLQDAENLPIDGETLVDSPRLMRSGVLAKTLVENGFVVTWFSGKFHHVFRENRKSEDELNLDANYKLILLKGCGYKKNLSVKRILHQHGVAREFLRISNDLRIPDLIVSSYPSPELCFAGSKYAADNGIPLIVDVRDAWPESFYDYTRKVFHPILWVFNLYYLGLLKKSLLAASSLVSCSRDLLEWSSALIKDSNLFTNYIYHSYPNLELSNLKNDKSYFASAFPVKCVFVGSFGNSYDLLPVIESAREMIGRGRREIEFVIIGDGEQREFFKKAAEGLDNVRFTTWLSQEEIKRELSTAHIGLMAYKQNAIKYSVPNKLSEYLAYSLAIVSTLSGEVSELIYRYQVGRTLEVASAENYADLFCEFLDRPSLLFEMSKNSQNLFNRSFSEESMKERYLSIIKKLLSNREGQMH